MDIYALFPEIGKFRVMAVFSDGGFRAFAQCPIIKKTIKNVFPSYVIQF